MSFDLDNLLGLLFFFVFIILPLISRSKKKSQPQQGQSATGAPPRQPVAPGQPSAPVASRNPVLRQPAASADRGASTTITLEEIARRVQEAQLRESASTGGGAPPPAPPVAPRPQRSLVSSGPFEGSLVSGTGSRTVLGREGGAPQPGHQRSTVLGREGSSSTFGQPGASLLGREGTPPKAAGRQTSPLGRDVSSTGVASSLRRSTKQRMDKSERAAAAVIGESEAQRHRRSQLGATLSPAGPLRLDRTGIIRGLIWHEILGEPPSIKRLRRSRSRLH